jgi:hypothetical protein
MLSLLGRQSSNRILKKPQISLGSHATLFELIDMSLEGLKEQHSSSEQHPSATSQTSQVARQSPGDTDTQHCKKTLN